MAGVPMDFPLCGHAYQDHTASVQTLDYTNESNREYDFKNYSSYNPYSEENGYRNNYSIHEYPPPDALITNPLYLTLTAGSILGNVLLLCIIICNPRFCRPANYLIINLSFSSILFVISANIRLVHNSYDILKLNTFRCQILAVVYRIPVSCVALTTMAISYDRGRVARHPLPGCSTGSPLLKIFFIWGFSIIILIPLAFTRVHNECITFAYKCGKVFFFGYPSLSVVYGFSYIMSVHIIPALILVREALKTIRIMRFLVQQNLENQQLQLQQCEETHSNGEIPFNTTFHMLRNSMSDNRLRLLRNSIFFTINFITTWLPYGIFQFPLDLPKPILPEMLQKYLRFYFRFIRNICYIQIAVNPVLLFVISHDFSTSMNWIAEIRLWFRVRYRNNISSQYRCTPDSKTNECD